MESFLRKEYPDHIFPQSSCHSHSKARAFYDGEDENGDGGTDDRTFDPDVCVECGAVSRFIEDVRRAALSATLHPEEESVEDLLEYLKSTLVHHMIIFIGHIVRKTHELGMEQKVFDALDRPTQCVVHADYKMKILSVEYRESMSHFFGKRGKFILPTFLAVISVVSHALA